MLKLEWLRRALVTYAYAYVLVGNVSAQGTIIVPEAPPSVEPVTQYHAFVSQGLIVSTDGNHYLTRYPNLTEAAFNLTHTIDQVSFGAQMYTRILGDQWFTPTLDWAQITYRPIPRLWVKAGRTKIPFGLFNEGVDVDAARVPALLPGSLYPDDLRSLLLAVNGGEIGGSLNLGLLGELEARGYGGSFTLPAAFPAPNANTAIVGARADYVVGGRLLWGTPVPGLTLAGSLQRLSYAIDYEFKPEFVTTLKQLGLAPQDFNGRLGLKYPITRWIASLDYQVGDLWISAEYGRWNAELESTLPQLIPNGGPVNERFYVMASYRTTQWLTPGAYYSVYFIDVEKRNGRAQYQHDAAAILRFDVNQNLILKLEGHLMRGTAALEPSLNGNLDRKQMDSTWGLVVAKATAFF